MPEESPLEHDAGAEQTGPIETTSIVAPVNVEATASRPHWITILLGLLSPLLGLVALSISLFTYRFSVKALEISQRAYVHVSITIEGYKKKEDWQPVLFHDDSDAWPVRLTISNTGNTPAQFVHNECAEEHEDRTYSFQKNALEHQAFFPHTVIVGGKTSESIVAGGLPPQDGPPLFHVLKCEVQYSDVFLSKHMAGIECQVPPYGKTSPILTECSETGN